MEKLNETIINDRVETTLTTHDFYYDLPEELIAQFPSAERDMWTVWDFSSASSMGLTIKKLGDNKVEF